MSHRFDQVVEIIQLLDKEKQINNTANIAHKRHNLQEEEFKALLEDEASPPEAIEACRVKLCALYEQYVDAAMTLQKFHFEAKNKSKPLPKRDTSHE